MRTLHPISAVIAEDNKACRELISSYLSFFPQVKVLAAVANGKELLEQMENENPTVAFLDIELPEEDGLSLAAKLRTIQPNIFIVFITAHAKYAAQAFQIEATDYLIKPVSKETIARSLNRIERFLACNTLRNSPLNDLLVIRNGNETCLIHPDMIFFIEKEIRKTVIHTEHGKYLTTSTLGSFSARLDDNFFRCHKSFIVNLQKIRKISPIAERIYGIKFYDYDLTVTMGRQKYEELLDILSRNDREGKSWTRLY